MLRRWKKAVLVILCWSREERNKLNTKISGFQTLRNHTVEQRGWFRSSQLPAAFHFNPSDLGRQSEFSTWMAYEKQNLLFTLIVRSGIIWYECNFQRYWHIVDSSCLDILICTEWWPLIKYSSVLYVLFWRNVCHNPAHFFVVLAFWSYQPHYLYQHCTTPLSNVNGYAFHRPIHHCFCLVAYLF